MSDETWRRAREPWERLEWARKRTYSTKRAAAEALGMNENTYKQYERGPGTSRWANMSYERALEFGKRFNVSWQWLLLGDGSPFDQSANERLQKAKDILDSLDEEASQQFMTWANAYIEMTPEQRQLMLEVVRNMARAAGANFDTDE